MFESDKPFLTGSALEALSEWSNVLKTFLITHRTQYFARSEARQSAFDYYASPDESSGTQKRLADGRAGA